MLALQPLVTAQSRFGDTLLVLGSAQWRAEQSQPAGVEKISSSNGIARSFYRVGSSDFIRAVDITSLPDAVFGLD